MNERTNPTFERSSEAGTESVRSLMTRNPASVTRDDPLHTVGRLMVEHDCGALPVVDGKRVTGMITDRDIVTRIVAEKTDPATRRVKDAMSDGAQTIREDQPVNRAFEIMSQHKVRRLPVINENGELTGMLAQADLATESERDTAVGRTVEEISEADERPRA
ncbi:MAG: CBS domain-containing protein [Thermoanaerobaculia bacterium]|nr:CBS domain-containing protein [Thermoanaerobaculia bacterium]